MHKYAILTLLIAFTSVSLYAFNIETNPSILIENENREKILTCLEDVYAQTGSTNMIRKIKFFESLPLLSITDAKATTGSVIPVPPKWYSKKHTLILTGSNDYRQYAYLHPWVAGWKNNNPSGLTWWVSNILKWHWNSAWIDYKQGTARPKNEKGHYILFGSVEHGIRAKMISIRERWWEATVSHFLSGWWTDHIKLSFSTDNRIKDLSENEFMELFIQQLKKESPWYISQLVNDWILIIWNAE